MSKPGISVLDAAASEHRTDGEQSKLIEMLSLTENSVATLKSALENFDSSIYKEFRAIAEHISETKSERPSPLMSNILALSIPFSSVEKCIDKTFI